MILTAKDALDRSMIQWQWYADNPEQEKQDYFEEKSISVEDRPVHYCYLCEYAGQEPSWACVDSNRCRVKCLLYGKWGNGAKCCEDDETDSFYEEWECANDEDAKRIAALKVLGLLTAARAELEK